MVLLRNYTCDDAVALLTLFRETIRVLCRRDYTPEQIDAWSSDSIDPGSWSARFNDHFASVAEVDGEIAGFADMAKDGYLDRLYVSARHQRQGIATRLVNTMIGHAIEHGMPSIVTDASITAKPFFERMGFKSLRQQSVECRGVWLTNYRMLRELAEQDTQRDVSDVAD